MFGFSNEDLFTKALQLQEPWYVEKIEFKNEELHMNIEFKKGYKFKNRNNEETTAYDTIAKTWRHLNFFQYKAYIHCNVPRIKSNNEINMVEVPWSRAGSGFTLLFESLILELAKVMTIKAISRIVGEHDTRLFRIVKHYVEEFRETVDYSNVTKIGIDETSVSGHNYITLGVDIDKSRVMYVTEGKNNTTVDRIAEDMEKHGCKKESIKIATSDMSPAFSTGIKNNFKNAINIFDKFHVMKLINESLDKVRKREVQHNEILKKSKFIFLKNRENLKQEQIIKLDEMLENEYLQTSIAYRFKVQFQKIYSEYLTKEEARIRIQIWMKNLVNSGIKEMKKLAKSIGTKLVNILNYFEHRFTNATLEGINSIIQMTKSRARGYRNIENFKIMIYLIGGKLDIKVPHYNCATHTI